jgi:putative MFS transporter
MARLPESPRWLIAKGRAAEAEAIIRQIEASTDRRTGATPHEALAQPARPPAPIPEQLRRGRWSEVLSPFYRQRTLIVWALWASAYFVTNGLNNWMPSLYSTVYHLGLRQSLRAASLTNVAQVLVLLICALCIDRIGRRKWILASFVAGGALLAALGWGRAGSVVSLMILGTLSYGILGSANAVLYLYTPEIYPTRIRAIGTGLATSWLRLASALGPAVVGMMVGMGGIASVFWLFAGICVVGAAAAARMIETRDQRLEEIAV